ncbi:3-carboxy-cis cis-mucoante lactonizing enzyme [Mycena floridula]|nr:3-carboxy-cis cis-mucoante lactonizing enzyme [Mycena floridula]
MLDGTQHVGDGYLYTFQVDSDAGTLELVNTTSAASAHPWLSVDLERRTVYASGWSNPISGQRTYSAYSYSPEDFTIRLLNSVPSCGTKPIANQFIPQIAGGIFYGLDFVNPCGDVWSVKENGAFDEQIQQLAFENISTLHGFVNTEDLKFSYVMDLGGNRIHTFELSATNGTLAQVTETLPSITGAGPRHAVIRGQYLYVIDEEGLRVDQFSLNTDTGSIGLTNTTLAVTPFGLTPANASLYWGDEIALSSDGSKLYASTRSRDASQPGYLAAWSLTASGDIDTSLFIVPTPEAGGTSNIISTSIWNDSSKNMLILTDQDTGFVALYQLQGENNLVELDRVNITGAGCCAGSVWIS